MSMAGIYLEIDLSTNTSKPIQINADDARKFLLGSGYAALLYYRELDPTSDALAPGNSLYIFNGLTTGTIIPTACRTSFCGRSPLTGIWNESNIGGHFGSELRKAGLDGLVIRGKASSPVYLYVHDVSVEIRPAAHLWGMDTFDTYDALLGETDPKARAAVIGPAGERLVRFAAIIQGGRTHSRAAGRGGMGAVFGSKLLKGIVVLGTEKVQTAKPDELRNLVRTQIPIIKKATEGLSKFGTAGGVSGAEYFGDLPLHNYTGVSWPEGAIKISGQNLAEQYTVKQTFCFACPIGCGKHVDAKMEDGTHITGEAPEYETLAGMGALTGIGDLDTMIKANDYCNRVGMDTISASTIVAFAMEAFENGLIKLGDCDNHEILWGDSNSLLYCLRLIAEKRGAGKILSLGSKAAAAHYGGGSEVYAMHSKGLELAYHDPRATFSMAANYATANRGACHLESLSYWTIYGLDASNWSPEKADRFSNDGAAQEAVAFQNYFSLYNPLGICKFIGKSCISPQTIAALIVAATGWEFSGSELLETGERLFNLKRMINNRLGISNIDDDLPERVKTLARPSGAAAGKLPDLKHILADYYNLRGWDLQGRPTQETKTRLGLEAI